MSIHHQPQRIGAATCGMRLLVRCHIGRAHRAAQFFAACAYTATHVDCAAHTAVLRIVEPGLRIRRSISEAKPQIRRERRSIYDLAWVQNSEWVERLFDFTKHLIQLRPKHLAQEGTADQSIAVL